MLREVDLGVAGVGVGVAEEQDRQGVDLVREQQLVEEVAAAGVGGEVVERRVAVDVQVLADPADERAVVQLIRRAELGQVRGEEAAAVDVEGFVRVREIQAEVSADVPAQAGVEAALFALAGVREVDLVAGDRLREHEDVGVGGNSP